MVISLRGSAQDGVDFEMLSKKFRVNPMSGIRTESPKDSARRDIKSLQLDYSKSVPITLDKSDPELVFHNGIIIGGTPEKLLDLLTNPAHEGIVFIVNFLIFYLLILFVDLFYITQFLTVYKYFITTAKLIEELSSSFKVVSKDGLSETQQLTYGWLKRQRIIYIITKWLKHHPNDFHGDSELCSSLMNLLVSINERSLKELYEKVCNFF